MAEIKAASYDKYTWTGGGYGNLTTNPCSHTTALEAIADTIKLMRLPRGCLLQGFIVNALTIIGAAGATLSISTRNDAGTVTQRVAAFAVDAGVNSAMYIIPVDLTEGTDLILTVAGAALLNAITFNVSPIYTFKDV